MNDTQFRAIIELLIKIKDGNDRMETNQEFDRHDFIEWQTRQLHLEAEFKSLREVILSMPKKTSDKISNAVDEFKQESSELKDVISDSKIVEKPKVKVVKSRPWWRFWQ